MSLTRYEHCKASGIPWLGAVPAHWSITKTKYVGEFSVGWTPPTGHADSYEGENLWANISDLGPRELCDTSKRISDTAVVTSGIPLSKKGSLLFSFKLSIGQVSFAGTDLYTNEAIATFQGSSKLDIRYAYFAYPIFLVQNASTNIYGAKLLNQELIRSAAFAIPPLEEQSIIADFLDRETAKIDALISEQEKLITLLAEKRQATISQAVTKGLNPSVPVKHSGVAWLGSVPEHWEVVGLTKYIESVVDYRGKTPTKVDDGIFLVTAKNIRNGEIDYDSSQEYIASEEYVDVMRRGTPEIGDVLFTTEAPLGQVAQIDRTDIALAQRVIKFRGNVERLDNEFLKYWIMGSHCQFNLMQLATGSTALGIKGSKVGQVQLCLPPIQEQLEIISYLKCEFPLLDGLSAEAVRGIELLKERRSALISAAVTGKIDVRKAVHPEQSTMQEAA